MRTVFSTFGLPEVLVTDNCPSFVSQEFEEVFFCPDGIKLLTFKQEEHLASSLILSLPPPYHKSLFVPSFHDYLLLRCMMHVKLLQQPEVNALIQLLICCLQFVMETVNNIMMDT